MIELLTPTILISIFTVAMGVATIILLAAVGGCLVTLYKPGPQPVKKAPVAKVVQRGQATNQ